MFATAQSLSFKFGTKQRQPKQKSERKSRSRRFYVLPRVSLIFFFEECKVQRNSILKTRKR